MTTREAHFRNPSTVAVSRHRHIDRIDIQRRALRPRSVFAMSYHHPSQQDVMKDRFHKRGGN
ncbi:MAG: hypothetical protein MI757_11850, partial [Pirellulales bacterium]|nr:hypothetical protein [Pirellulales bacterium]